MKANKFKSYRKIILRKRNRKGIKKEDFLILQLLQKLQHLHINKYIYLYNYSLISFFQ